MSGSNVFAAAALAGGSSPAAASSTSSSSSAAPSFGPLVRRASATITKPCCVVGCNTKREKEGYCLSHFMIFKQGASASSSSSGGEDAARAKAAKQLKALEKAKALQKEANAERVKNDSKRASVIAATAHGAVNERVSKSWWKSATMGGRGCFSSDGVPDDPSNLLARPAIPESPLLLEVRSAWHTANKVVYKDLPRLAKRMSIQTEEHGVLVEAGRIVRIPLPRAQRAPPADADDSSASSLSFASAGASSAARPARQSRALSIGSWEAWKGFENETWVGKESLRRKYQEVNAQRQLGRQDAAASSPAAADQLEAAAASTTVLADSLAEVDTWTAVCNVLLCTLEQLESAEVVFAARSALSVASSQMHVGSDHQSAVEGVFERIVGLGSRTFKVFQAIHQAILFPAIAHLHTHLYSHPAVGHLKDCRRADGWTVLVYLGAAIYVTHTRWEQSLHPEHDPRHFQVKWEMRLSFDQAMDQLRACILRIQEIAFHPDATPAYRRQISYVRAGSGYIVQSISSPHLTCLNSKVPTRPRARCGK